MTDPLSIIIVEDQALLAAGLQFMIEDAGHNVAACAGSLDEALKLGDVRADVALVDIHLSDGPTGVEIAHFMFQRDVLVVFMTANVKRIPEDFAKAVGVIAKPYTAKGVTAAIEYLHEGVRTPPPKLAVPAGMSLLPGYERRWA